MTNKKRSHAESFTSTINPIKAVKHNSFCQSKILDEEMHKTDYQNMTMIKSNLNQTKVKLIQISV